MTKLSWSAAALALVSALPFSSPVYSQEVSEDATPEANPSPPVSERRTPSNDITEEIVVIGSYVPGTSEQGAAPVDVFSADDLTEIGSPSIVELVRNLGIASGNIGESNQFQGGSGGGQTGRASINLRGLGPARTLVLINGTRQTSGANFGVDIAAIPSVALARIEVLKDGAAALYGSDALGGVVNFVTDNNFEGFQIGGNYQDIADAGDYDSSLKYGLATDNANFMLAFEYRHRDRLQVSDRDFAAPSFDENPQAGFSNIGQPGTLLRGRNFTPNLAGGTVLAAGQVDPQCEALGGVINPGSGRPGQARCAFQFTPFDNLIEEEDRYSIFSSYQLALNDNTNFRAELLWHTVKNDYFTSPSFPPQSFTGPDRFAPPHNPGLMKFKADNPEIFAPPIAGGNPAVADQSVALIGRVFGVGGNEDGEGFHDDRQVDTYRLAFGFDGTLFDGSINYQANYGYSKAARNIIANDTSVENLALALNGYGTSACDVEAAVAADLLNPGTGRGQNGCEYFNPFSNAIQRSVVTGFENPQFDASVANSSAVLNFVTPTFNTEDVDILQTFDLVFSGETPWELSGGGVSWAAGLQARRDTFEVQTDAIGNPDLTPCPFNRQISVDLGLVSQQAFDDCQNGVTAATGGFAFVTGSPEVNFSRGTYGAFGELQLPVTDQLSVQLALRFEQYEGETGNTLDPKIAAKWQITDSLALRASASTTFRGPPQQFLTGRNTALAFITPASAFRAVVTNGNEELKPESANAYNFGVIVQTPIGDGDFYASVDYFRFEFEDPFQTESANQILDAFTDANCVDVVDSGTMTNVENPNRNASVCDRLDDQVILANSASLGSVSRIETNILNGGDFDTAGVDLFTEYTFPLFSGEMGVGLEASHTLTYETDDFLTLSGVQLAEGDEFVGRLNDGDPFTPKPRTKAAAFANFSQGIHSGNIYVRHVSGYNDIRPPREFNPDANGGAGDPDTGPFTGAVINGFDRIDSHTTIDLNYNARLMDDKLRLSLSVFNLTDRDPPKAALDLNYDPFTHSAFGRLVKLGATYNFDL